MNYIDLTRTISPDLPRWPGDPSIKIERFTKYGFIVDEKLTTTMHIGTHIDAPIHMIEAGKSLAQYPPEKFIGRGVLLNASNKKEIDIDLLKDVSIHPGDIVLILTGSESSYGTPTYFNEYPIFTEAFTQKLIESKINIIGIDSPSPDHMPFPMHKILLANDILIIEVMTNLEKLLNIKNFEVIALPPKFDTAGSFLRVIARII